MSPLGIPCEEVKEFIRRSGTSAYWVSRKSKKEKAPRYMNMYINRRKYAQILRPARPGGFPVRVGYRIRVMDKSLRLPSAKLWRPTRRKEWPFEYAGNDPTAALHAIMIHVQGRTTFRQRSQSRADHPLLVNSQAVREAAEQQIERLAGFQANPKIKKAVEMYAMRLARKAFEADGYEVEDVSHTSPYDFRCTKSKEVKYLEVKGTQSPVCAQIVLTAGEVTFVEKHPAASVLCIVQGVSVKGEEKPLASGGMVTRRVFDLTDGKLKPIAFTFRLKLDGDTIEPRLP